MQPAFHRERLYSSGADLRYTPAEVSSRLSRISSLAAEDSVQSAPVSPASLGRNAFTRTLDRFFRWARHYLPPVHRAGAVALALVLSAYAKLVALTARLLAAGIREWPNLPAGSVVTVWHGSIPSLLVAIVARRPRAPVAIMISGDPRGDSMALLCRLLSLKVVRGDSEEHGWEALAQLADHLCRGACALITADGGGPAQTAKIGAVALAEAAGAPLVAIGADCRPALFLRRKWDKARIPLPFSRIAITFRVICDTGELLDDTGELLDHASVERARLQLQNALNAATHSAQNATSQRERRNTG